MVVKALVVMMMLGIGSSLLFGGFFLAKDDAHGKRSLLALKCRITLSLLLFALLMLGLVTGVLHPHALVAVG